MAHFKVKCSFSCLPQVRTFVRTELKRMNIPGEITHQLVLAIDEACANSFEHQHRNDNHSEIDIYLHREGEQLIVEIRDEGVPFPIDKYEPQKIEVILRNRTRGGLGLHLILKIMDKVEVDKRKDHFIYRFTKFLST